MRISVGKIKDVIKNPISILFFMLIVSFLSQMFFLYDFMSLFRRLVLVWGGLLIVYAGLFKRHIFKNKYSFLLLLFCIENIISVCVNYHGRFFNGIVTMGYVCIYLLIFFNTIQWNEDNLKSKDKILEMIINLIIGITMAVGIIAIIMFAVNVVGVHEVGEVVNYYGMRENRLWGLYNANTAASIALISIAASLMKLQSYKEKWIWVNIGIQYLYLVLTQSRTGWLLLIGFAVLYTFFMIILPGIRAGKSKKESFVVIICCILAVVCLWFSNIIVKKVVIVVPKTVSFVESLISGDEGSDISLERVDEERISGDDAVNGRDELWSAAFQVIKDDMVLGISSENIIDRAEQYLSEERYGNLVRGGFHNSFLTIFVSSGIIGIGILAIFLVIFVWDGFKYLICSQNRKVSILIMLLFTMMANELMESRWLYNTSFLNIIFWVLLGIAVVYIQMELKNKDSKGDMN